jgi:hypothetical protein
MYKKGYRRTITITGLGSETDVGWQDIEVINVSMQ